MTQVEALAKYAARASFSDLSAQSRKQLPVHILDSLGCCIAALGAGPVEACRTQVADFGGDGPCALIGLALPPPISAHGPSPPKSATCVRQASTGPAPRAARQQPSESRM